jgi:hypothetical protein
MRRATLAELWRYGRATGHWRIVVLAVLLLTVKPPRP